MCHYCFNTDRSKLFFLTTAKQWADELTLDYVPTLIFYNESGKEIIRVDSVVGFFRLQGVLRYVNSHAYRTQPSFQLWRAEEFRKKMNPAPPAALA